MGFAARYIELPTFAAKNSKTVERTVNDRLAHTRVEVSAHSPCAGGVRENEISAQLVLSPIQGLFSARKSCGGLPSLFRD